MAWDSAGESSQCLWRVEGCYTSVQCFKQHITASATAVKLYAVDSAETSRRKAGLRRQVTCFAICHFAPSCEDGVRLVFTGAASYPIAQTPA